MKRTNGLLAVCLSLLLLAPMLYVASSGPVVWLGTRGYISLDENALANRV